MATARSAGTRERLPPARDSPWMRDGIEAVRPRRFDRLGSREPGPKDATLDSVRRYVCHQDFED